jgi:hypothetical protein
LEAGLGAVGEGIEVVKLAVFVKTILIVDAGPVCFIPLEVEL